MKSEVTDIIDLVKLTFNAAIAVQKAKAKAKAFVMLYLTSPEFKEYVNDNLQEMASQVEVLWNNREVLFKAVKEKVIEVADSVAKAALENLIQTFEAASGLQRDEEGFVEFSVGYSIGNVAGFVAETLLIAAATAGAGLALKAGKLGKIGKFVGLVIDASKVVDPSELLKLLNPKTAKKILFEGAEQIGNAASGFFSKIKRALKSGDERVFENIKSVSKIGPDELKLIDNVTSQEFTLCRSQFKSELIAEGMTDEAAEKALRCLEDGCFSGDTLVTTKTGLKRIDSIKEGDYVLSKDVNSGTIDYKEVKYVYIKSTYEFVHLFVEGEEIRTTANHLFFTDCGWWKAAENLKVGDKILNSKGELKTLIGKSIEALKEPEKIYNLNVDEFHTYFVGTNGLLVHNNCTADMMAAGRSN